MKLSHSLASCAGTAALIVFGLTLQAGAQTNPSPSPSASASPSGTPQAGVIGSLNDLTAINYLHHVNNLEIQEAQSAQVSLQSSSTQAQALAQAMLTDHQQNEQQVVQLASQKGLVLYTYVPATYETAADSYLASLSGTTNYDQTFMSLEKEDHQEVLNRLQSFMDKVSDPDIKNLIAQTIPIVEKHLALASAGLPGQGPGPNPSSSPSSRPSSGPGTPRP